MKRGVLEIKGKRAKKFGNMSVKIEDHRYN